MEWASSLSRRADAGDAFAEAAEAVAGRLGKAAPDLLLAFASPEHAAGCQRIAALARRRFPAALLLGSTGRGVIGDAREAEDGPALSLTAAAMPGARLAGFHLDMTSLPPPGAGPGTWREVTGAGHGGRPKFLLLADPYTMDAQALIAGLEGAYRGAVQFGGLASGGRRAGENRLLLGGEVHRSGAVGVALSGNVEVDAVIAQGCRPIGKPMLVARCRGGLLQELDRGPPLRVLQELYRALEGRDRELMQHSLFLGLDMRDARVEFDPSELLVRNLVGADEKTGALAVGAELRQMQVVQFVLRDAQAAEEDLRRQLERHRRAAPGARPAGALLFSCVGRGAGLFGRPDHDTGLFEEALGPAPLGGFFCNGEIGPVGGSTFLHGYTSAFALFREARERGKGRGEG
ncbi:MAG TPA: FIST N-terminal domain-containing protein [Anaeromyxobacteraceae bacterium]